MNNKITIQKSFLDIPWYVMNRQNFIEALNVGYLMKNLQKGLDVESNPYKHYGIEPVRDFPVFQFIYSKMEMLLGEDFMDQWYSDQSNEASFDKACTFIDDAYGEETFNNLYKNIEVILCNKVGCSIEPLSDIAMEYNGISATAAPFTNPKRILKLNTEICNIIDNNPKDISKATAELEILVETCLSSKVISGTSK